MPVDISRAPERVLLETTSGTSIPFSRALARYGTVVAGTMFLCAAAASWMLNRGEWRWYCVALDSTVSALCCLGFLFAWHGGRIVRGIGWSLVILTAPVVLYQVGCMAVGDVQAVQWFLSTQTVVHKN